jgi:hypothetical protein
MDKQFARVRVIKPLVFDFKALAEGIRRNNVGTAGIEVEATAEVRDGQVVIQPTGQTIRLAGPPSEKMGAVRRRLKVVGWEDSAKTEAYLLR